MSRLKLVIIFIINMLFDIAILPRINIAGVTPYISIAIIVVLSMRAKSDKITYYAIFMGLLLDIASSTTLGIRMLSFYLISYYTYKLRSFDGNNFSYGFLATIISVVLNEIYLYCIKILSTGTFNISLLLDYVLKFLLLEVVISLILYTLFYLLVDRIVFKEKRKFFS